MVAVGLVVMLLEGIKAAVVEAQGACLRRILRKGRFLSILLVLVAQIAIKMGNQHK